MRSLSPNLIVLVVGVAAPLSASFTVRQEMVSMRDGVKLAADVYLPAHGDKTAGGKFPVLVVRTPYNKSGSHGQAAYLAERGFAVVAQDVRGRFASAGEFYHFVNEGKDGYDTIEWAAAQPWSDGKVGTFGASYLAWDQYCAAMYRPPHLSAMFALVGGANFYDEYGYLGGVPNLGWPIWMANSARSSHQAAAHPEAARKMDGIVLKDAGAWLRMEPAARAGLFRGFPEYERLYNDWAAHPQFDDYWRQRGFYTEGYWKEMKDVPVYFVTGWYDYFIEGVLKNFEALSRFQKSEKKLLVGPWPHGTGAAQCGDVYFGPSAAVDQNALMADWFGHWLKGAPYTWIGPEKVRVFRMGGGDGARGENKKMSDGGQWNTLTIWPPAHTRPRRFYFHENGLLTGGKPGREKPSHYRHDPDRLVPSIGGRDGAGGWSVNCAQDQKPLNGRTDVLHFATAPLPAAAEVTGMVRVAMWVSSDAETADFIVKLIDVAPNGYALILVDGERRLRFRSNAKAREVTIDIGSIGNLFAAGHRIRVDIASSNFPKLDFIRRASSQTVYHDAGRASFLEAPVMAQAKR
ncbi:MAG: CocE/NonD family hydrolase [Bryobacteraceae bacterium]